MACIFGGGGGLEKELYDSKRFESFHRTARDACKICFRPYKTSSLVSRDPQMTLRSRHSTLRGIFCPKPPFMSPVLSVFAMNLWLQNGFAF